MNVVDEFMEKSKRSDKTSKKISLEISLGKNVFPACIDYRITENDFFEKIKLIKEYGDVKNIKKNIYYEYFFNDMILHVFSDGSSFCYKNRTLKESKEVSNIDNYVLCYELYEIQNLPNDLFPSLLEYNMERKNDSVSIFFDGFIVNFILCSDTDKYYQIKVIVNNDLKNKTELIKIMRLLEN